MILSTDLSICLPLSILTWISSALFLECDSLHERVYESRNKSANAHVSHIPQNEKVESDSPKTKCS